MEDSIFTKIIKGEIPSYKVYEDEKTYAFLDISPVNEGHTLIVPKTQVEFVWELNADNHQALMVTVKKVADKLREVYPDQYIGELIVGVDVPHAHVHLIPFSEAKELRQAFDEVLSQPNHANLAIVAEKLRFS